MYAEAQHEVVGIVEIVEAVSNVDIAFSQDMNLQGKDLVKAPQVISGDIDDVMANAEVDGEIGHDELHTP